jgi:cysteinyl-tRNA synthetase
LQLFNTLTERKEELRPRDGSTFRVFVCGPTVQDNVHLGHAKTYIAFDVLARWLLKNGFKVDFLLNITDIDDKIFDRAKKESVPYMQIADRFFKEFLLDIETLNIQTVSKIKRVSNFIPEAMNLVQQLLAKEKAYKLEGNTYFDTSQADHFGKLSHQSQYQLKLKQIDAAPGKKNSVDFLLWRKISDSQTGTWESPLLGKGRPGWHIEDSAIAFAVFGGPYDLHGGATELIFPHHESELAQNEAISGVIPFVSHWMHTGLLLNNGEKMSKSLNNDIKIQDALKDWTPDELRFYFLKRHYRDSYDYDSEAISKARQEFEPVRKAAALLGKKSKSEPTDIEQDETYSKFSQAMNDDLNTPKALQILVKLSEDIVRRKQIRDVSGNLKEKFWIMIETLGFRLF